MVRDFLIGLVAGAFLLSLGAPVVISKLGATSLRADVSFVIVGVVIYGLLFALYKRLR